MSAGFGSACSPSKVGVNRARSGEDPCALGVIAGVYATIRQHARWLSSRLIWAACSLRVAEAERRFICVWVERAGEKLAADPTVLLLRS